MKNEDTRGMDIKERKRREIIDAAYDILKEKGINKFTVKDVSDRIGIGRGTLYEYIKTKTDIIYIVLEDGLIKSIRALQEQTRQIMDPLLKLKIAIHEFLGITADNYILLWALVQETTPISKPQFKRIFKLVDDYNNIFKRILEEGNKEGIFDVTDSYLVAHCITTMLNTWIIKSKFLNYKFLLEDYEMKIGKIILQGVLDMGDEHRDRNLDGLRRISNLGIGNLKKSEVGKS